MSNNTIVIPPHWSSIIEFTMVYHDAVFSSPFQHVESSTSFMGFLSLLFSCDFPPFLCKDWPHRVWRHWHILEGAWDLQLLAHTHTHIYIYNIILLICIYMIIYDHRCVTCSSWSWYITAFAVEDSVNSHLKVSGGTRLSMAYPTADPWRLAMWTAFLGDLRSKLSKLSKADAFTLIHPTSSALSQAQENVQLCYIILCSTMFYEFYEFYVQHCSAAFCDSTQMGHDGTLVL